MNVFLLSITMLQNQTGVTKFLGGSGIGINIDNTNYSRLLYSENSLTVRSNKFGTRYMDIGNCLDLTSKEQNLTERIRRSYC